MTPAAKYNAAQLIVGKVTPEHVTELVRFWQHGHGLTVDGMAGPVTLSTLTRAVPTELSIGDDHWFSGPGVTRIAAHASWFGGKLKRGEPGGIVAHYTATDPGTAMSMARRRARLFGTGPDDRLASWHVTIDTDGSIVQMIPLDRVAYHAGSQSSMPITGLGTANSSTVGIELVGHGDAFPAEQVAAAKQVWRAIVQRYGIAVEHAMIEHSTIDPARRKDPGPVWIREHAQDVLDFAFG